MKKTTFIRMLSLILCGVLAAAAVLTITGCKGQPSADVGIGTIEASTSEASPTIMGDGEIVFDFSVTDGAGTTYYFEIHTAKGDATVGDVLTELGLIAGEEGAYGLYVKTVADITVDYDKDGAYWAFYENGKYAMAGVDTTPVASGGDYAFQVERG